MRRQPSGVGGHIILCATFWLLWGRPHNSQNCKGEHPAEHLAGFHGKLQVDGYTGFSALVKRGTIELVFCWAHCRRRFYEFHAATRVAALR